MRSDIVASLLTCVYGPTKIGWNPLSAWASLNVVGAAPILVMVKNTVWLTPKLRLACQNSLG